MANRTTQIVVEALGPPSSPSNRTTQIVVEALGPRESSNRVTQVVVEVLGTPAAGLCWTACLGKKFLFTEDNWSSADWYFEAYIKATTGTAKARLYNVTDGVEVPNSVVSTTSATYTRVRSVSFTLTDGKEYCGQFGVEGASAEGVGLGFRLINI